MNNTRSCEVHLELSAFSRDLLIELGSDLQRESTASLGRQAQSEARHEAVRWLRKMRELGSLAPAAQGRPRGHGKLAPHRAFLEELICQDGDITLPELAGALEAATGVTAHPASIGRFLRKLGYTYKKSHWWPPNASAHE